MKSREDARGPGIRRRDRRGRTLGFASLAVGTLTASILGAQPSVLFPHQITLTAQSVPLSISEPSLDHVGSLRFMGGLALHSPDPGFGGLSGLIAEARDDGKVRIIAVTDQGATFRGNLVLQDDRLRSVDAASLEPLSNLQGAPIRGKTWGDAESLVRLPDGRVLVGFERRHRIWAYGPGLSGAARIFETPPAIQRAPLNDGLEALAAWPDGSVLAFTQGLKASNGNLAAFLQRSGSWSALQWQPTGAGFEPSDSTVLPGGELLVLERAWSASDPFNPRVRLVQVSGASVQPGAVLTGRVLAELKAPLISENFEGLAAFTNRRGRSQILMVADDNFNRWQRSLLLSFELPGGSPAR